MLKDKDLLQYRRYKTVWKQVIEEDSNENSTTENTDYSNEDENGMIKRLIILKMKNNQKASLNIRV